MRYIHPAAWCGLLLNALLVFVLSSALNTLTSTELSGVEPAIIDTLRLMRPFLLILLGMQALSVGLIASRFKWGLVLAAVSSFFMLPAALVYLIGCVLSHYRWKYAAFDRTSDYGGALSTFPLAIAAKLPYVAGGGVVLGGLCLTMGMVDMGIMFLALGLTAGYLVMRTRKFQALSIHQQYFTIVPGIFADALIVPYAAVRAATLYDDESIRFDLELESGKILLSWPLGRVDPRFRRSALESLGQALASHDVPLY